MSLNEVMTSISNNFDAYKELTPDFLSKLDTFVNEVEFKCITIILANGLDLINLDLTKVSKLWYFISDMNVSRGGCYIVTDEETKRLLYHFIKLNPDRIFRGEKEEE